MSECPRIAATERTRTLEALESGRFDCLVIGGGITGAGVARDAALRGLSVALLEADDFAAGTSGRSSKLIHGGFRYLAMGEVALVRETALERKRLHAIAPHLAEPVWMVVPARSRAGLLKFRTGLATYEKLGAVDEADRHRNWVGEELARREPSLNRERFPFACAYREYLSDDARLVLANLRSAVAGGALVASRARVVRILDEAGRAIGVEALCEVGGEERRIRVRAGCVVNAAGPWVEGVARMERSGNPLRLHLSKGIHVVLPWTRLPVRNSVLIGTPDKRTIFAIPRGPIVYLGTTDTSYPSRPTLWPEIQLEDVRYLLAPVSHICSGEPIAPEECLAAWSGLRPLVAEAGKPPTEISRRDEIQIGPSKMVTVAGGKLTGYRKMAIQVMEKVAEVLEIPLPPAPAGDAPLAGGDFHGDLDSLAAELRRKVGLDERRAARLVRLYGAEAEAVAARGRESLVEAAAILTGEVDWAVECEGAATLEDVLYRRTRVAIWEPESRESLVEPVARRMRQLLGWSEDRAQQECRSTRARFAGELAFLEGEPARAPEPPQEQPE
jgi:glycerol-3-phosphate dehydrogenase